MNHCVVVLLVALCTCSHFCGAEARGSAFHRLTADGFVVLFVSAATTDGGGQHKRSSLPYRLHQKPGMKALVDQMERETPRPKSPHMNNEEPIELAHFPNADRCADGLPSFQLFDWIPRFHFLAVVVSYLVLPGYTWFYLVHQGYGSLIFLFILSLS